MLHLRDVQKILGLLIGLHLSLVTPAVLADYQFEARSGCSGAVTKAYTELAEQIGELAAALIDEGLARKHWIIYKSVIITPGKLKEILLRGDTLANFSLEEASLEDPEEVIQTHRKYAERVDQSRYHRYGTPTRADKILERRQLEERTAERVKALQFMADLLQVRFANHNEFQEEALVWLANDRYVDPQEVSQ